MKLTEKQKRHLRGLGHALSPCVHVGNAGVTPAVIAELGHALDHHELLKVRIRAADREARDEALAAIIAATGSQLLSRVGHVALIYKPNPESPRITLPA
jgi:RNA-binding protein